MSISSGGHPQEMASSARRMNTRQMTMRSSGWMRRSQWPPQHTQLMQVSTSLSAGLPGVIHSVVRRGWACQHHGTLRILLMAQLSEPVQGVDMCCWRSWFCPRTRWQTIQALVVSTAPHQKRLCQLHEQLLTYTLLDCSETVSWPMISLPIKPCAEACRAWDHDVVMVASHFDSQCADGAAAVNRGHAHAHYSSAPGAGAGSAQQKERPPSGADAIFAGLNVELKEARTSAHIKRKHAR